ncbi:hypothetical protein [Streptomyces naganishii]|uniref:Uncharacterized protein n=1 Tax=Streptomyces naganishii JCM 4654 TaxID=1306179 RepID=A0A919CWG4_9ACTN|nr:hypothetical protein [Streptomyces naganishii]GHD92012.1 hypothetical protein GCM10010508_43060 [Streptomyces naganishii JCM 4654]
MAHAVAALGAGALTAAGCVWYVPALADLRAGADRPDSRRFAAAACVTGWAGTAVLALLLLVAEGWWAPGVAAVVGATATAALRLDAAVLRRREVRETARQWARLGGPAPAAGPGRTRHVVAAVVGCGLAVAVAVTALHVLAGPGGGPGWLAAAAPVAVMAVFLLAAATYARSGRETVPGRRTTPNGRPSRTRHGR